MRAWRRICSTFRALDLDMIGIGPYIAHPATPLGSGALRPPIDRRASRRLANEQMVYKMIALARILCPTANIPSTTALATINRAQRAQARPVGWRKRGDAEPDAGAVSRALPDLSRPRLASKKARPTATNACAGRFVRWAVSRDAAGRQRRGGSRDRIDLRTLRIAVRSVPGARVWPLTDNPSKIVVCLGSSCFARGNAQNLAAIEEYLQNHGLKVRRVTGMPLPGRVQTRARTWRWAASTSRSDAGEAARDSSGVERRAALDHANGPRHLHGAARMPGLPQVHPRVSGEGHPRAGWLRTRGARDVRALRQLHCGLPQQRQAGAQRSAAQ